MPLPVLVTFVIREPVEPPRNWMPLPVKPLIVRALPFVAGLKTTLLTFAPITRPLVPAAVPMPSSVSASFTATLLAADSVMPASGVVPPTAPASPIAPPEESVSLLAPSTVDLKLMPPPATSDAFCWSVTAPRNVCPPKGAVTPAPNRMPLAGPVPCVLRLTAPAPLDEIALAIVIVSVTPAPVSMLKLCAAPPFVTAVRFTPPGPIVIASVPTPPTIEMPANDWIAERFTAIVSAAESIVIPAIGAAVESVPAVAAVIVSTFEAAE